jgi:hypothetical protein
MWVRPTGLRSEQARSSLKNLGNPSFDGEAAQKEALVRLPGLADHFEKEAPRMHKTNRSTTQLTRLRKCSGRNK